MKKVQRSFAVEYKTGRRKTDSPANTIWGNLDLKSIAQGVELETGPFLPMATQSESFSAQALSPTAEPPPALLTTPERHPTTAEVVQETSMADENETLVDAEVPPAIEVADVPKKERKPRTPKAALAPVEGLAGPGPKRQKRGPKPKLAGGAEKAKRSPNKRVLDVVTATAAAPATAMDEMADLLQLEEENHRLRKLLSEKLRTENADLRKRLNLD